MTNNQTLTFGKVILVVRFYSMLNKIDLLYILYYIINE